MSIFADKVLLITGGTGSFGNAVLRRFLDSDIREIRIFSRDEKKQDDMRHHLQSQYPEQAGKVKFYIGNVRSRTSVDVAMRGVDYVFSAAALKQVPSCEFFPMEATRTNVLGTENVLLSAIEHGRCAERGGPVHRQGGVSDQRHGHLQGPDGEGRHSQGTRAGRGRGDDDLLHALRQRDGQPGLGDSPVGGADDGGQADNHH